MKNKQIILWILLAGISNFTMGAGDEMPHNGPPSPRKETKNEPSEEEIDYQLSEDEELARAIELSLGEDNNPNQFFSLGDITTINHQDLDDTLNQETPPPGGVTGGSGIGTACRGSITRTACSGSIGWPDSNTGTFWPDSNMKTSPGSIGWPGSRRQDNSRTNTDNSDQQKYNNLPLQRIPSFEESSNQQRGNAIPHVMTVKEIVNQPFEKFKTLLDLIKESPKYINLLAIAYESAVLDNAVLDNREQVLPAALVFQNQQGNIDLSEFLEHIESTINSYQKNPNDTNHEALLEALESLRRLVQTAWLETVTTNNNETVQTLAQFTSSLNQLIQLLGGQDQPNLSDDDDDDDDKIILNSIRGLPYNTSQYNPYGITERERTEEEMIEEAIRRSLQDQGNPNNNNNDTHVTQDTDWPQQDSQKSIIEEEIIETNTPTKEEEKETKNEEIDPLYDRFDYN